MLCNHSALAVEQRRCHARRLTSGIGSKAQRVADPAGGCQVGVRLWSRTGQSVKTIYRGMDFWQRQACTPVQLPDCILQGCDLRHRLVLNQVKEIQG